MYHDGGPRLSLVGQAFRRKGGVPVKIQIKRVEAIKATRIHLDPTAGGA
jgi:hypothetical protein